jgi:hypothetical protein
MKYTANDRSHPQHSVSVSVSLIYRSYTRTLFVEGLYYTQRTRVSVPSLGSPTPSPPSECVFPLGPKWGSNACLRVREWGRPIRTICTESPALCILCGSIGQLK